MDYPSEYIKKPIIIQAIQFNGENIEAIRTFTGQKFPLVINDCSTMIQAEKGDIKVYKNDWVIRDELYDFDVRKPDVFEATYQLIM